MATYPEIFVVEDNLQIRRFLRPVFAAQDYLPHLRTEPGIGHRLVE